MKKVSKVKHIKIIQVIDFLHVGGAEKMCVSLTNLLHNHSYTEVSLLLLSDTNNLLFKLNKEIPIIKLKRTNKWNVFIMKRCADYISKYDIVHVHMRHNYRYIRLIQLLFGLKCKILLHDHYGSIDTDTTIPFGLNTFLKPKYYIGVSKSLTSWATKQLKLKNNRIFLLANSIDKIETKQTDDPKKGFVLVGNIKPIKNQLFAIELMQYFDSSLTIYGAIQDRDYYNLLIQKINALKLNDKIRFIHDCTSIQKELKKYNLGFQVAFSESGPLVLIEYLAQNLPFIAYNTGEVVQEIRNELPEYIIGNFEHNSWVQKIEGVLKTDTHIFDKVYKKYYSKDKYIAKCLDIYNQILKTD